MVVGGGGGDSLGICDYLEGTSGSVGYSEGSITRRRGHMPEPGKGAPQIHLRAGVMGLEASRLFRKAAEFPTLVSRDTGGT